MEEISLVVVYVSLVKKKKISEFILYGFDRHIY